MAGTRASDADRDASVDDIESAFADGRIDNDERESRTQSALQATTLTELSALVADLRPAPKSSPTQASQEFPSRSADRPASHIAPGALVSLLIVTIVGASIAVAVWAFAGYADNEPAADTTFPTLPATSTTSAAPVRQSVPAGKLALHTSGGFKKFVALTRAKFGTTLVESAALYPDYASVNVATAANPRHTERWYFAKGYEGDPSKGTIGADVTLIDIAKVDTAALARAIKRSPSVLGVENVDTTYVVLRSWEGLPAMAVYVSNEFHETGYWVFGLKGKALFRYAFE